MSLIIKELLEEKIQESPNTFIDIIPQAYNLCVTYLEMIRDLKKVSLDTGADVGLLDSFEVDCIKYIKLINSKIVP